MNNSPTVFFACNDCSIALGNAEVVADPKVEKRIFEAGQLLMGVGLELRRYCTCDFCEVKTKRIIQWERY